MLIDLYIGISNDAYIAGTQDGIVTVGGQPARRDIIVFNADSLAVIVRSHSLENGHYLITGLDPNKRYLLLCRDYKGEYEPCAYDLVSPAHDLTFVEQQDLWHSWQGLKMN